MATSFSSNEPITDPTTSVKLQNENIVEGLIDGWIFSSVTGILTTPLGMALTNSAKNHTGLRLWGKVEQNNGLTVFKTQSWSNYQKVNLDFAYQDPTNDVLSVRNALMCVEPSSIRVFIIDICPVQNFLRLGVVHTNTFILIGDETGTGYLVATDLAPDALLLEKSYSFTQVRRKMFKGVPILSTTINTQISPSVTSVIADISEVTATLIMDLNDEKTIISSIEEVGAITRSNGCSTCKGDLTDVSGAAALVYCQKCQRHSLKKNISHDISTTLAIKDGEEKLILWVTGQTLEQLLILVGLPVTADDTEIAMTLLSNVSLQFEYSELRKELISIGKP